MDFVKKEWKAIALIICLIVGIVYLKFINDQLDALKIQNAKIISTFDSVESVTISTNSSMNEMSKQVDSINSNVSFIVKKVRRR